ncbi:MAG: pirin family protein [Acidimicrobiia bacterium]
MNSLKIISPTDRFHNQIDWLDSYHIFNFSYFYKDDRNGFGDLLVVNDDHIDTSSGFGMHPHHDMEIVTWILNGELTHEDNKGNTGVISEGDIQQMSAGSGVLHSEFNHNEVQNVDLLQMWLLPDRKGVEPRYQQQNVADIVDNELGLVASGQVDAPIHLYNQNASLYIGKFSAEKQISIPNNEKTYIYVARGEITFNDVSYDKGFSLLIENKNEDLNFTVSSNSEVILWSIGSQARISARLP